MGIGESTFQAKGLGRKKKQAMKRSLVGVELMVPGVWGTGKTETGEMSLPRAGFEVI